VRTWTKVLIAVGLGGVLALVAALSYALGRTSALEEFRAAAFPVQAPQIQEMIPLPGPGRQFPGQQPQPDKGAQECEAKVYLFFNGRFYEMRPGPGQDRLGVPGGPQEFYPLQPTPGVPTLPAPGPNPFIPRLPPLSPGQRY
jgi:hypothetical protein